jgi:hypothetical protein
LGRAASLFCSICIVSVRFSALELLSRPSTRLPFSLPHIPRPKIRNHLFQKKSIALFQIVIECKHQTFCSAPLTPDTNQIAALSRSEPGFRPRLGKPSSTGCDEKKTTDSSIPPPDVPILLIICKLVCIMVVAKLINTPYVYSLLFPA